MEFETVLCGEAVRPCMEGLLKVCKAHYNEDPGTGVLLLLATAVMLAEASKIPREELVKALRSCSVLTSKGQHEPRD